MRRIARVLAALVATALLVACGGRQELYELSPGEFARAGDLTLPPSIPASPAFVLKSKRSLGPAALAKIEGVRGVAVAAPVALSKVKIGRARLTIASIHPLQYRSVAPASTRDADFVWLSLLSGNAIVTHEAARRLGPAEQPAVELPVVGRVAVGAFADNGAPNVADIIVSADAPAGAVGGDVHTVVIGAKTGTVLQGLERALGRAFPAARLTKLSDTARAAPPRSSAGAAAPSPAAGTTQGGLIGTMSFEILKDGFIRPDPAWTRSNIAGSTVPILGRVICHRVMFPQLRGALTEIQQRGLEGLIRRSDYGGCFVPRFIDRNPSKPLSMHAFGLAIDVNVSSNGLGTRGDLDARIVEIFEKWGFEWGGRWGRPDPMHFELDRLLTG